MTAPRFYQVARAGGPRSGPLRIEEAMHLMVQIREAGGRALLYDHGAETHRYEVPSWGPEPRDPWGGAL